MDQNTIDVAAQPVASVEVLPPDPAQQFDIAIASQNPKGMHDVAKNNPYHPVAVAATNAADLLVKGDKAFNEFIKPIEDAGGLNTPQGKQEIVSAWDKKNVNGASAKDILLHWITGNGEYARDLATGGKVISTVKPDAQGNLVRIDTNALGRQTYLDQQTNVPLTIDQVKERGVNLLASYENSLKYKSDVENQKTNQADFLAGEKQKNGILGHTSLVKSLSESLFKDLDAIKQFDLDPKTRALVSKTISQNMSNGRTTSDNVTRFDQAVASSSKTDGSSLTEQERLALGAPIGAQWQNGNVKDTKTGVVLSLSSLRNNQTSGSTGTSNEAQSATDRTSIINSLRQSKFANTPEGKILQDTLIRALDTSKQIRDEQTTMVSNYGKPAFLPLPNAGMEGDPFTLLQGKAIQNMTAANIASAYNDYFNQWKTAHPDVYPKQQEIQAGFVNSDQYKRLLQAGMDATHGIINTPTSMKKGAKPEWGTGQQVGIAPTRDQTTNANMEAVKKDVAMVPGVPAGAVQIGTADGKPTRDGKPTVPKGTPIFRTPDGKNWHPGE